MGEPSPSASRHPARIAASKTKPSSLISIPQELLATFLSAMIGKFLYLPHCSTCSSCTAVGANHSGKIHPCRDLSDATAHFLSTSLFSVETPPPSSPCPPWNRRLLSEGPHPLLYLRGKVAREGEYCRREGGGGRGWGGGKAAVRGSYPVQMLYPSPHVSNLSVSCTLVENSMNAL